jgi:MFS family permease
MTNSSLDQPDKNKKRFFYGYIIILASFFVMLVTWGIYTTFGLFLKPFQDVFGWSNADISLAYSLSMIIYGVLGFVMGGLNDRFGPRIVMSISGVLLGLGFILMSRINSLWHLFLFYGIIGIGMSGLWVPQMSSIARWFTKRRSLVTGIVLSSVGIGQVIAPPIISRAIATHDWRTVYIVMGGILLLVVVLGAQFMKRDPADKGCVSYGLTVDQKQDHVEKLQGFTLKEAAGTPQFYICFMMLFCYGFGASSFLVHIVRHAIALDIPAITAANILAANGAVSIVGSFIMGGLGDRIGIRKVFICCYVLLAITMFGMIWATDIWELYILSCILAMSVGSGAMESPLAAWMFGLKNHGVIYGIIHIGFTAGAAVGPFLMGYIFDVKGSYQMAFPIGGAFAILGIIITLILRPTKRREKAVA